MAKDIPLKLYKFQTFNKYSIQNLKRGQIWFSKPRQLNDPFDCAIPFVLEWTDKDFESFCLQLKGRDNLATPRRSFYITDGKPNQKFQDSIRNTNEYYMRLRIINQISGMGISCFTENLDNILMWSHYADSHKAFCLEFDTKCFPFLDPEKLHKVIYSDKYPSLAPDAFFHDEYMPIDILITKSLKWKYENEWRQIIDIGNTAVGYDARALTAVYFGCSMPDKQMRKIAAILAKSATSLFKMQRSYKDYALTPTRYKE
jgi:hypothetical protein